MKKQLVMTTLVFITSTALISISPALAITGRDSWKVIRASHDVLIEQPAFAGVFGDQGLFNACATEDEFRSLVPVKTCLSNGCEKYEIRNVTVNRVHTKNICVRFAPMNAYSSGECVDYKTVTAMYPTSFQLPVIEGDAEQSGDYIFSKNYSVPACE